jgi:hypothetical protein
MKKNSIIIIIGLIFLITAFTVGTPIEFLNTVVDTLATILFILFVILLFIILFRLACRIEKKKIKWLTIGLLTLLAIPYLWTCLWTLMITGGNYHPMWQDISIYTNKDGEKVITQWRETSGSIYDYRDRRIFTDFGQFRISLDCNRRKLKGNWSEYNIESRTTKTVNFEMQKGNTNE